MLLFGQSEKYEFVSWCFRMKKKNMFQSHPGGVHDHLGDRPGVLDNRAHFCGLIRRPVYTRLQPVKGPKKNRSPNKNG